jgi:hypothetical protein
MSQTAVLTLETLHYLSEGLRADFDQQLAAAVADCKIRPAINKPREIKLLLRIKPHPQDADDVLIEPVTTTKTPARAVDPIRARRSAKGQLQFDFDKVDD